MSLNSLSMVDVVRKQVKWKCRAYSQSLFSLIVVHIIFGFLTASSTGMSGMGFSRITVNVHFYSLDMFVFITSIWAFITTALIQTKGYRHDDFSVVTNRTVSSISNVIVVVLYSIVATFITFSSLYTQVTVVTLFSDKEIINELMMQPLQLAVVFSIILLATASGYFIGSTLQLSKIVTVCIIIAFIWGIRLLNEQLITVITFFFKAGYPLFIVKAMVISILLFAISVLLLKGKEVIRQ